MRRIQFCILAFSLLTIQSLGYAQDEVTVAALSDCRLINEPTGLRNDNNGGNTIGGALIGINTSLIDNIMIYDFAGTTDVPELTGATVSGATVIVEIAEAFSNANEGSAADMVVLHEIAIGNAGFNTGNGSISGDDNPATDGSTSFNNREEFNSASSAPWVDTSGSDASDLLGALTELDMQPGIFLPDGQENLPLAAGGEAYFFNIDAATAQGWVDNGLAGLALTVIDNGDDRSRFNMSFVPAPPAESLTVITFTLGGDFILGDINGDGVVDLLDVGPFVDELLNGGSNPAADIDGNGVIDLLDVGPFVDLLLGG